MTVHVTLWLEEKGVFLDWGREDHSDLIKHVCFCNPLNTRVVIISGLLPANPPQPTLSVCPFPQGLKGKLMLLHMHVLLCFNSWYLLVISSISTELILAFSFGR